MEKNTRTAQKIAFLLIRGYQYFLSPWVGNQCRFYPRCSEYTRESIEKRGILRGIFLGMKRLSKCHPFHPGGFDPVQSQEKDKSLCP